MNSTCYKIIALIIFLGTKVPAQVYNRDLVGYYNTSFVTGSNLFTVQLQTGYDSLSGLFPNTIPQGTTVSFWDPATSSFDSTSTFSNGSWSVDMLLQPGTGALLFAPSAFINTLTGYVLNHDGNHVPAGNFGPAFSTPPLFTGPSGIYLLGDKSPLTDIGVDIFLNIIGRLPNVGEQVTTLDKASQTFTTSTYLGGGNWDNLPTLGVGDAAFLNIESVPEPTVLSLFGFCFLLIGSRIYSPTNTPE